MSSLNSWRLKDLKKASFSGSNRQLQLKGQYIALIPMLKNTSTVLLKSKIDLKSLGFVLRYK